jgi:hypothetical protein
VRIATGVAAAAADPRRAVELPVAAVDEHCRCWSIHAQRASADEASGAALRGIQINPSAMHTSLQLCAPNDGYSRNGVFFRP